MASCHNCGKRVGVLRFWLGTFKHLGRNFWRSRQLPISNCPHCGTEIQESVLTSFGSLGIMVVVGLGFIKIVEGMDLAQAVENRAYVGLILFLIAGQWLWWRLVSRLKEPTRWG